MMDNINDNDYFEMSIGEKINLRNEITHDLQQLVMNICSKWDDMSSSIDYNEFGSYVQDYLKRAAKQLDCSYICGQAWGAH